MDASRKNENSRPPSTTAIGELRLPRNAQARLASMRKVDATNDSELLIRPAHGVNSIALGR
jgi:hypothetical protein